MEKTFPINNLTYAEENSTVFGKLVLSLPQKLKRTSVLHINMKLIDEMNCWGPENIQIVPGKQNSWGPHIENNYML